MGTQFFKYAIATGTASVALLTAAGEASAFTFTTNFEGAGGKEDVFLQSVILESGEIVRDFSFITSASIVSNDTYTGGNTGAASADKGDKATTGLAKENVSAEEIAANLGTNNLNNIIDTEDKGSFRIDLNFSKAMDNLLIWERGMNSDLGIQALSAEGKLIGNYLKISRDSWTDAGFSIDTTEIGKAQKVGSFGVNLMKDLGVSSPVSSVRFFSESSFNGPDWKFVGTDAERPSEDVPEPGLVLGLSLLSGAIVYRRRQTQS
ncbi:PEP-CTERM sorting domain-containing protein [filamentous cyanobacterium CCP5]|nr:PEP-CTERM sorting domain-containing protein [filamentous cyanobacterium CCP5]